MKIVFLSRLFYPHIGGVEQHVLNISRELNARGHSITIITEQYDPQLSLSENFDGIEIIRLPHESTKSKRATWSVFSVHHELLLGADMVHVHDVFWWVLPLKLKHREFRYAITFHGWEGKYPPNRSAILQRRLAAFWSKGMVVHVGEYIERWYHTKAKITLYGATRATPLKSADPSRLLVLGRLSEDNDLLILFEAFARFDTASELRITYLGDGPYSHEASRYGKVLGFHPDITPYLARNGLVITSSYQSMADAMAAGRYVISTAGNPLKLDYLESHPMSKNFSITTSASELETIIREFVSNPSRFQDRIDTCQLWARQQTWQSITNRYEELWQIMTHRVSW